MKHLLIGIAAFGTLAASAQGTDDLLRFSQYNFGISTARSAAMGGAFTSLGADAASMSLNPAGLAMYRNSEVSITPGLRISPRSTDYSGTNGNINTQNNSATPNLSNLSAVYADRNFAIGFGLNRLADFNGRVQSRGYGEAFSMGDMFVEQLYGTPTADISGVDQNGYPTYNAFYSHYPSMWGAIMGYQTGLVDPIMGTNPQEYTTTDVLAAGAILYPSTERITQGAINEYAISGAYNAHDLVYLGATLGIQDIYYNRFDTYSEYTDLSVPSNLDNMTYRQNLRMSGTGINLKVGATVRPADWLRIGVAYHSPTWISMSEEYDADMTVYDFRYTIPAFSETPILTTDYNLRSSSRLLSGASVMVAGKAILTFDYERVWYQNIKYTSSGFGMENTAAQATFRPTNNFRAGVETQFLAPSVFLRAGYGYSQSPYVNNSYNGKTYGDLTQCSGGLGYRTKMVNVDITYVYNFSRQMPYKPFDYTASDGYNVSTNGSIFTQERNHTLLLSLAFKF